MAADHELVAVDSYNYLAVSRIEGNARHREGTICMIEVGRGTKAPDDADAILLTLGEDGVRAMILRLQASLDAVVSGLLH